MNKIILISIILLSFLGLSCSKSEKNNEMDTIANGECVHGEERDLECGLNGRGLKHQDCFEGEWVSNYECVDPDVCKDGTVDELTCGVLGTYKKTCVKGQWDIGDCEDDYLKPDGVIPSESKSNYLYFSAKKTNDKYNSDLYMIDMTGSEPTVVQLTDTKKIDEISPSSPADNTFMIYADGYYNDPSFSKIRYVKLDSSGRPLVETDKEIISLVREECNGGFTTVYFGKGNPSVSLDGSEIVFVNTYEVDVDDFGCSKIAFRPAKISIDSEGNIGTYRNLGWDEGPNPGRTMSIPLSPIYLGDSKSIVVSYKGIDQHPMSSEIQICDEECDSIVDWWYLTYQAIWSMDNVAQVSLGASMAGDDIVFFRSFSGFEFNTGIYTASDLNNKILHPIYGLYGVLNTTEKFISGFSAKYMGSTHRAFAFSPDGKLIAVSITFVDNEIKDQRHSNIAILERETGKVVKTFEFLDSPLREVDGLHWR